MDAEPGGIIRFKQTVDQFCRTYFTAELFQQEKPCIGGKIASVKINLNLAIAF